MHGWPWPAMAGHGRLVVVVVVVGVVGVVGVVVIVVVVVVVVVNVVVIVIITIIFAPGRGFVGHEATMHFTTWQRTHVAVISDPIDGMAYDGRQLSEQPLDKSNVNSIIDQSFSVGTTPQCMSNNDGVK